MQYLTLSINGTPIETPGGLNNVTADKAGFLGQNIITLALNLMFIGATLLCFFYLILGGIQWISSGGDKHGVEMARAKLIYAVIGLVIVFLSYFIIYLIGHIFGVTLISVPTQSGSAATQGAI